MSVNLYSLLPDTLDTQHAKELTEMQSEVGGLNNQRTEWPAPSELTSMILFTEV